MTTILWTAAEIAKELGVPTQTVNTWAARRQIIQPDFLTLTKRRLWTEDHAAAIIAERTGHVERMRARKEEIRRGTEQLNIAMRAAGRW